MEKLKDNSVPNFKSPSQMSTQFQALTNVY